MTLAEKSKSKILGGSGFCRAKPDFKKQKSNKK